MKLCFNKIKVHKASGVVLSRNNGNTLGGLFGAKRYSRGFFIACIINLLFLVSVGFSISLYAEPLPRIASSDRVNASFYHDNILCGGKTDQPGEWHFEYDKDGQLTEKYRGSGKWWDGNVPLHEWNSGRRWKDAGWEHYELDLKTWVFEEESFVPMALLQNGKAYSIVTDQLGTPTEAYNSEGEEVWHRRLDMNGKVIEEVYDMYAPYSDRVRIPFLFQGQYYDYETELAYNRFRYYSPELGRYISEDPIRLASGEASLFLFVENTTIDTDLFGLARSKYATRSKASLKSMRKRFNKNGRKRFLKKLGQNVDELRKRGFLT